MHDLTIDYASIDLVDTEFDETLIFQQLINNYYLDVSVHSPAQNDSKNCTGGSGDTSPDIVLEAAN